MIKPDLYRFLSPTHLVDGPGSESVLSYVKRTRRLPNRPAPADLTQPPTDAHFLGMDAANTPADALRLYQIDELAWDNDARMRITVSGFTDECFIPYSGRRSTPGLKERLEPVAEDHPITLVPPVEFLPGGGRQVNAYGEPIVTKIELWNGTAWVEEPLDPFN